MKRFVRRVAISNHRVTQDKIYELNDDGKITDDKGESMKPCLTPQRGKVYWERVTQEEIRKITSLSDVTDRPTWDNTKRGEALGVTLSLFDTRMHKEFTKYAETYTNERLKLKEENKMLKIEDVTLIDGKRVEEVSNEVIMNLIVREEERIEDLEKIKTESKAISNLKAKHTDNITKLVSFLDAREED